MGHLLLKLDKISEKQISKFEKECKDKGKNSFHFAWVMDENIEESVQAKGDILITRDPLQDQKKQNHLTNQGQRKQVSLFLYHAPRFL